MKQKLILLLKTLFASKGFSAKALEGLADYIAPNLTEESTQEEITAAIEAVKPVTDIMQSEINRQINDAKKPKVEEPKPEPKEPEKPEVKTDDMPEWAKALVTSTQALAQGLQAIQTEKIGNTRRAQVEQKLAKSDDKFKATSLKAFGRMKFETEDEFNEYLTELENDAKDFAASETDEDGISGAFKPMGGAGGSNSSTKLASDAELDAVMENL